ncbi:MAG: FprA family A-type flavoprotein [Desulfomonilia bacterium]|jgi:flavorubredoxin
MHDPIEITKDIYWIGVNDYETDLFEAQWPLPEGVSYNSYLVTGRKTALIDTVKKTHLTQLMEKIRALLTGGRTLDYLVINHMEPDHSGAIPILRQLFPEVNIVGNKKTMGMVEAFYGITTGTTTVEDGDGLDLGGHELAFALTPMVHWPETMMTYDRTSRVLFSGDAFGTFKTLDGGIFDDELDIDRYEDEMLRYFSNIVGKYSPMVQKAMAKLKDLEVSIIATTHGPVWRKNPGYVTRRYDRWSRYEAEPGVMVAYASMYGSTRKMAEAVCRGLTLGGVRNIRLHDVSRVHLSYLVRDAWRFQGLALGSCTYEMGLFPAMKTFVELLQEKKLMNRTLGIFGSFGWTGGSVKDLKSFVDKSGWSLVEPLVEVKCSPDGKELEQCIQLGANLARAVSA